MLLILVEGWRNSCCLQFWCVLVGGEIASHCVYVFADGGLFGVSVYAVGGLQAGTVIAGVSDSSADCRATNELAMSSGRLAVSDLSMTRSLTANVA